MDFPFTKNDARNGKQIYGCGLQVETGPESTNVDECQSAQKNVLHRGVYLMRFIGWKASRR
jgi:hypothetical protein